MSRPKVGRERYDVRLLPSVVARLDAVAAARSTTRSALLEEAAIAHLDEACREAAREALSGARADTAAALSRCDWSEVRLALDESGELGRWRAVRRAVLAHHPGADI